MCVDDISVKGWWQCKEQKYLLQHKSLQCQRAEAQIPTAVCSCRELQQWLELVSPRVSACPSWACTSSAPMEPFRWVLLPSLQLGVHPESFPCPHRLWLKTARMVWRGKKSLIFVCDLFRHLLRPGSPWMPPPGPGSIASPCPWWNGSSKHWDTTSWQKHWTLWVSIKRGSFRCVTSCLCASLGSSESEWVRKGRNTEKSLLPQEGFQWK